MTSVPVNGSDDEPASVGITDEPAFEGFVATIGGTTDEATTCGGTHPV